MTALVDPAVADLQARVAALEQALARVGSPETLQPNYLTVDPAGNVGANFTGRVHAQGLDLDAPLAPPADADKVRWLRTDTGAVLAQLASSRQGGSSRLLSQVSDSVDATGSNDLINQLRAQDADTISHLAGLDAGIFKDIATVRAVVSNAAANRTSTILDENGASNFLQIAGSAAQRAMDVSSGAAADLHFAASAAASVVVAHTLGRTPTAVWAFLFGAPLPAQVTLSATALTASSFTLNALASIAISGDLFAFWFVIG